MEISSLKNTKCKIVSEKKGKNFKFILTQKRITT